MKIYHRITNKIFDTENDDTIITNINELKNFICKNMNGVAPKNIKFIKNGREIKGHETLIYENIEFIIIPISCTCTKHI